MINWEVAKKVSAGDTSYRTFTDWSKFGDDYPDEQEELSKLWRACVTSGVYNTYPHTFNGCCVYSVECETENGLFTAVYNPELNGSGLIGQDPLYVQWLAY